MTNMSYCRFQNTLTDFKDCGSAMERIINGEVEPLSAEEVKAAAELAVEALKFLEMIHQTWDMDWRDADEDGLVKVVKAINMNAEAARKNAEGKSP